MGNGRMFLAVCGPFKCSGHLLRIQFRQFIKQINT